MGIVRIEIDEKFLPGLDVFGAKYRPFSDNVPALSTSDLNPADFLFLEGRDGKEGHPDLWYSKHRLQTSPSVKQIGKNLGLDLADTAQEKNGRGYIGNINHGQALRLNLLLGGRTTNAKIETDVFRMLLSGKAYDGRGKIVDKGEIDGLLDEKVGVRNPGRAEWLEDSFKSAGNGIVLMKNYVLQGDVLVPSYNAPLRGCLMNNKTPGINFRNWVKNSTSQGWPRANIKEGETYYWSPTAGNVARLVAYSGRAYLVGNGDPHVANSWLGVRHLRVAPKK